MTYQSILLIEDDKDDQEHFVDALGCLTQVIECTVRDDAEEALTQLETKEIQADLIFLDLVMPRMTGQRFLYELKQRENLRHIPVIVLCTAFNAEIAKDLKQSDARVVLVKPDTLLELKIILKNILW